MERQLALIQHPAVTVWKVGIAIIYIRNVQNPRFHPDSCIKNHKISVSKDIYAQRTKQPEKQEKPNVIYYNHPSQHCELLMKLT